MPIREHAGNDDLEYRPPPQPGESASPAPGRRSAGQVLADLFRSPEEEPDAVVAPAPAPAAKEEAQPRKRQRRQPRDKDVDAPDLQYFRSANDWRDRMIAESFIWICGWALWAFNALFTIKGLGTLSWLPYLGPLLANPFIAFGIQIGISKAEQNLWRGGLDPWAIGFGIVFLAVDVGTTVNGLIESFVQTGNAGILGTLPKSILQWWALIAAITSKVETPEWAGLAVTLLIFGALIAIGPELIINHFRQRMMTVWRSRPIPAAA